MKILILATLLLGLAISETVTTEPTLISAEPTLIAYEPNPQDCPIGTSWDPINRVCNRRLCNIIALCIATHVWDPIRCRCVCPDNIQCAPGDVLDQNTCQCFTPRPVIPMPHPPAQSNYGSAC